MSNIELKFSILIPAYKGAKIIMPTLQSILDQDFKNYEIIIQEDASGDNIEEVVRSIGDSRIKFFRNDRNLGYPGNLEKARQHATGDVIYLMGQDDILAKGALRDTNKAFLLSEEVGAVTRPYYWFDKDTKKPVRAKKQLNPSQDEIVQITDDKARIIRVFEMLDQLSGLAYRVKFMDLPFHPDIFPCHVYPFASIFKKHPIVFLKDYNVAVRISTSQSRHLSSIYDKSPMQSWVEMFEKIFSNDQLAGVKKYCIEDFVARNYVGLVQIRNFAQYRYFWREVFMLLKYRWQNIFSLQFWFFTLGCAVIPPAMLIRMVDWYKSKINARGLRGISIKL